MGFEYLFVGVPVIAGLVGIVYGVRRRQQVRRLTAYGQSSTAIVEGVQRVPMDEGRDKFRPVVRFRTHEGSEVRTALDGSPSYQPPPPGTPLDILYDPADPQHARPVGNVGDRGTLTIVVGFGFLIFAVAAYFFVTQLLDR
jgi:hypothetical protein